jgi:hypothetical protein
VVEVFDPFQLFLQQIQVGFSPEQENPFWVIPPYKLGVNSGVL